MRRILLIEDTPGDVRLIRQLLSDVKAEYTLTASDRLSSGLRILEKDQFDLVLLDLSLPDSSGIGTLQKVQEKELQLPVIVLTGLADEELALKAIALGAQDYLVKGQVDSDLLLRSMRYAMERKRAEEALRESETRLRGIAFTALDAIILIDNDGNVSFWNEAAARIFGYTQEEIMGKYLHSIVMPERHIDAFNKGFEAFRRTGEGPFIGTVYEIEAKRKDGTEFPVELSLAALRLKGRWHAMGIVRDITDRKEAERSLARISGQRELILEAAGDGIFGMDGEGYHILANRSGATMLGYRPDELMGRKSHALWHHTRADGSPYPEDECLIYQTRHDGISRHVDDEVFWRKDGTAIPVEYTTTPIIEGTAIGGTVVTFRDIAERKRIEEALQNSKLRLQKAISIETVGVLFFSLEGRIFEANAAFQRMSGYSNEELRGITHWKTLTAPEFWKAIVKAAENLATRGETPPYEKQMIKKDGSRWWGLFAPTRLSDKGVESECVEFIIDLTERKRVEEELQKAQRLESIGLLAGGIAHDFNNILMGILGNISLARTFLPPGDKADERLKVAEQASMRARDLSQQLLTFAKGGAPIRKTINLPVTVTKAVELAIRGSGIRTETFFPLDLRPVKADESQLHQAIKNVAINAIQAMSGGGILSVAAANVSLPADNVQGLAAGDYVRIDFKDQGIGIPEELQGKIFDPFFTTKERGSGLGLSISFSIIQRHGGTITVESRPGEGSTFSIFLPASEKERVAPLRGEAGEDNEGKRPDSGYG